MRQGLTRGAKVHDFEGVAAKTTRFAEYLGAISIGTQTADSPPSRVRLGSFGRKVLRRDAGIGP